MPEAINTASATVSAPALAIPNRDTEAMAKLDEPSRATPGTNRLLFVRARRGNVEAMPNFNEPLAAQPRRRRESQRGPEL